MVEQSQIEIAEFEGKEPKVFKNPPALKRLIGETHDIIDDFHHSVFLYVQPPYKPSSSKRRFPEDWERYEQEKANYDKKLDEAIALIKPEEAMPRTVSQKGTFNKLFSKLTEGQERKRKQAVIDGFNQDISRRLMDLRRAAFFGTIEETEKIAAEVTALTDVIQKGEEKTFSLSEAVALAKSYKESAPQPEITERYSRLTRYVTGQHPHSAFPSSQLTEKDSEKIFYVPQLNLVGRMRSFNIFRNDIGPYLSVGYGDILPVSEDLLVIPLNIAFPRPEKKTAQTTTPNELPKESGFPATLESYLDALQDTKGQPDPNETIKISGSLPEEATIDLILHGANPFYPSRQALLDAGYVFVNAIGGGEKYIIKAEVMINGELVDLGKIPLLTQKQLDAALALDKQELADISVNPPAVARDMLDFLHAPSYLFTKRFNEVREELRAKNPKMGEAELYQKAEEQAQEEWKNHTSREIPLKPGFFSRGVENMGNVPCPFLTCGHHLGVNRDLTFEDSGSGYVRFSTVVAHLAHHGLSERGDGLPVSIDQRYMTIKQYYELMMKPTI